MMLLKSRKKENLSSKEVTNNDGVLMEAKHLDIGYGKKVIYGGLNFSVKAGDFICIVGPNGAGKSTLVKTLLGLIKPLNGEIRFYGLKRGLIGFLPQEIKIDENFPATVFEIVLSGNLNRLGKRAFFNQDERKHALSKMKLVGISELKDRHFVELSGGQRQKVMLARALTATQDLLILDEPSNSLDRKSTKELYATLKKINQNGITIMMITHDLDHGNLIGNKILALRDTFYYGATDDFVKRIHDERDF